MKTLFLWHVITQKQLERDAKSSIKAQQIDPGLINWKVYQRKPTAGVGAEPNSLLLHAMRRFHGCDVAKKANKPT